MKIEVAHPPNMAQILEVFPKAADPGVIFAWGDTIYNPSGNALPPALLAHEAVHGFRQGSDVEGWWTEYLRDPEFRYREEVVAHAAELRTLRGEIPDRNIRARLAMNTARRLLALLYNYGVSRSLNAALLDLQRHL